MKLQITKTEQTFAVAAQHYPRLYLEVLSLDQMQAHQILPLGSKAGGGWLKAKKPILNIGVSKKASAQKIERLIDFLQDKFSAEEFSEIRVYWISQDMFNVVMNNVIPTLAG
jgi:hypothetical protein